MTPMFFCVEIDEENSEPSLNAKRMPSITQGMWLYQSDEMVLAGKAF